MIPHSGLFKHKATSGAWSSGYVSPYMLEIAHTGTFSAQVATGTLTANAPGSQTVSCSRAASGYCLGNDGLLHLLGANTVRVEPTGLLVEPAATNVIRYSTDVGNALGWTPIGTAPPAAPTVTQNSTDVLDPAGTNEATKAVYPAVTDDGVSYSFLFQAVVTGVVSTFSVYIRTATGTATIYLGTNAPGEYVALAATTTWQRFSVVTAGAANFFVLGADTRATNSDTPGISACTVYLWGAQVEAGAFPTSLIRTVAASASRDADIVTVANPLNPSNPGTWRMALTATPLSTWANVQPATLLGLGTAGAANTARWRATSAVNAQFDVLDNASAQRLVNIAAGFSGSATTALVGRDVAGVLSTVPAGSAPSGAGTGVITTQAANVNLGAAFAGHLTDIYVDPT